MKRYSILTPFGQPEVLAGVLHLHEIDAFVVLTASGALVVRDTVAPVYDKWDIRNITGPDGTEEIAPSDNGPEVATMLSRLTPYGVVLIEAELGEDTGIESGVSGQVKVRRFLGGEAGEEIAPGALLNVVDPMIEKIMLGIDSVADHEPLSSTDVTTEMLTKLAGRSGAENGDE